MKADEMKALLEETGALLNGHFLLTSGRHSGSYVEKFRLLEIPWATEKVGRSLAEAFEDFDIQVVVGPMTGGILLAHETAKVLKTRSIFTERVNGKMEFRRGFEIKPNERVLIVEDIVTTGGSVWEVIEAVKEQGGEIVGVGLMVDRTGKADFEVPTKALLTMDIASYEADECPLCKAGEGFTERGSRNIKGK